MIARYLLIPVTRHPNRKPRRKVLRKKEVNVELITRSVVAGSVPRIKELARVKCHLMAARLRQPGVCQIAVKAQVIASEINHPLAIVRARRKIDSLAKRQMMIRPMLIQLNGSNVAEIANARTIILTPPLPLELAEEPTPNAALLVSLLADWGFIGARYGLTATLPIMLYGFAEGLFGEIFPW